MDSVQDECTVQSVDRMLESGMELPAWLDGTPIVVDTMTKQARKGTVAYTFLCEFAESADERASRDRSDAANAATQRAEAAAFGAQALVDAAAAAKAAAAPREMMGVLPYGERYMDDDDTEPDNFTSGASDGGGGDVSDAKLTDTDLERYMEMRNKQLPHLARQVT